MLGLPDPALSALFEQAGVIRVDDLIQQFDVAQLLAYQPLPAGPRVGLVSNSDAMALLAADACARVGLEPRPSVNLGARAGAAEFGAALASVLPDVDAVVAIYMPPIPGNAEEVGAELLRVSRDCGKPVLATFEGKIGMLGELRVGTTPERGSIPSYTAPEEAVRALAHVVRHARWLEQPAGVPEEIEGVDTGAARSLVLAGLGDAPAEIDASRLLARYGVEVWPSETVGSPQEAVDAATRLGWPVVLKAEGSEAAKHAGTVRLGLSGPDGVRDAYADLTRQLEPGAVLAVQRMAPQPAVPTVAGVMDDPAFGAVVSFGLGEITARLLHDEAYRLAPLTREDAAALVRSPRAAPCSSASTATRRSRSRRWRTC